MLRLLLVCSCALTPHLLAQTVSFEGRVAFPFSSSQLGMVNDSMGNRSRIIERGSGIWGGIALDARVHRFRAGVTGMRGALGASDNRFPGRSGGEVAAAVQYEWHSTFTLEARHTTRVYSSAAGRQTWRLWGVRGAGRLDLGTPLVRAVGALTYLPLVTVSGEPNPRFGIAVDFALTATPRRSPLEITAGYRIEKFAFPFGSDRAEQFEALILSVGLRMERREGRWGLGKAGEP
jgi:hypothetical protein